MKLSSERRKELQDKYKQMKPDMGIFAVINKSNGKHFLETTQNLKGKINSVTFQLKSGGHPNKELQKDWRELGANNFEFKIIEKLEYDEDESKTDYTDELELLKIIWMEKLTKENIGLY